MRILLLLLALTPIAGITQNARIDSLKRVIETTKVDTVKGRALCKLSMQLEHEGEWEAGLSAARQGLSSCQQAEDEQGAADCWVCLGSLHYNRSDYDKAIDCYQKSLRLHAKIGDRLGVTYSLNNLGNIYFEQGDYPRSLEMHQRSLKIKTELGDSAGIAASLNNICGIYYEQGDLKRALNYCTRSLSLRRRMGVPSDIANGLNNMGNLYIETGDTTQALESYQQSLKIRQQLGDKASEAVAWANIGSIHYARKDLSESLKCYQKSLEIESQSGDRLGMAGSLSNIGQIYLAQGQSARARKAAEQSLALTRQIGSREWTQWGLRVLYQADSALGDWKAAFEHHRLYKAYSDSLKNDEQSKELGRLESKYEFEKQAEEEKRKAEEAARIEAERTERRNALQYLSIFAGLIALFGALVFLGRLHVNARLLDVALFAGLLILFEFLLVLFDPIVDDYSGGVPLYKLLFNTGIAVVIAPLHHFTARSLRRKLVKTEATVGEKPAD